MEIFGEISPLKAFLADQKKLGKTVGLVPTMGALHEGHLALLRESLSSQDLTVCSIFVNPAQFNNVDDLKRYPRPLEKDVEMLEKVGCQVLFVPGEHEMYPEHHLTHFSFGHLDQEMEGQFRPGHFAGVALVVSKLFNIVEPDAAYFGQKDWQQFIIIRQIVRDLNFTVRLVCVPTVRELDGLALSSRNTRLNPALRPKATALYQSLEKVKKSLLEGVSVIEAKRGVKKLFYDQPEITLEYFHVVDSENLEPLSNVEEASRPILCIAAYVGEIRLIDNMFLDLHEL